MTNYLIDIQQHTQDALPVQLEDINTWASLALKDLVDAGELTILLVDKQEIQALNKNYRQKDKPTNVLAFPSDVPEIVELDTPLLGDIIICPEVLHEESIELNQPVHQHWAHIVIHGVLHLLGFDHIQADEALDMQTLEIKLLSEVGFANPYEGEDDTYE